MVVAYAPNRRKKALPRLRHLLLLATGVAYIGVPAAQGQQRARLEQFIFHRKLANGLEVVVAENHGVPLATIEFDVRNGAFTQSAGTEGLAHLYEHMFFKANADYPQPDEFLQRAGELGAVFNATTQEERVNYYMTLPSSELESGLRLMVSALRRPLFRREELEREREVVLGEYDRNESSPFFELERSMTRLLYPGYWSRKNIIGERAVLQRATVEQLRQIQRRYYVPNNTVLIVTGDVDPERVFTLATELLGDWAPAPDPFATAPIPPVPPLERDTVVFVERDVGAVTILVQWQGPSVGRDRAATFAADVFSDALNQPGSRLHQRLVDSGLFQAVMVNYYTLNYAGPITISGQTTPDRLREALRALNAELARLGDSGYITQEQLEATKAQRAVSTAFGLDRPSELAHTLGFWWSVAGLEYYLQYVDEMARQSLEDLQRYARSYIVGKPRVVGILLPPGVKDQLRLRETEVLDR